MEAEEVLNLFDSYWFELEIFKTIKHHVKVEKPKSSMPTLNVRSQSSLSLGFDQISFGSYSSSQKLKKVPSGIEVEFNSSFKVIEETKEKIVKKKTSVRKRNRIRNCKSLTELEVEELKGFVDLGFVFSEEDKDSKLVTIIPGLNRLGRNGVEEMKNEDVISRPYLSESWGVLEKEMVHRKLIDWKIKALDDRTDVKDHLKVWAQTVASTLRY